MAKDNKRQGQSPMETELSPHEMLQILPHMTKEEKKLLYKTLKKEQEAEAALYLNEAPSAEKMRRPDQRRTGYTAAKPNKAPPAEERASSSAARPPPSSTDAVSVPEVVRQRKLKEFRRTLYENALDKKGRLKPSAAADFPVTAEQENCTHPWEGIRWGANGSAHWGHCKQCHLKRVLYYSNEHGAMVAGRVAQQVFMLDGGAVSVILDTGCRTAVAGSRWHRQFQKALEDQQLELVHGGPRRDLQVWGWSSNPINEGDDLPGDVG